MRVYWLILIVLLNNNLIGQVPNTLGVIEGENDVFSGLVLFSPIESTSTYLIDNCGFVVNQWTSEYTPGSSVYLREDGKLIRTIRDSNPNFIGPKGPGGGVEIYTWEGKLIWSYKYNTNENLHHHDIALLPNGNILLLAWDLHNAQESIAKGRNPDLMTQNEVWSEHIIEVNPNMPEGQEIVWSWYLFDHLIQDFDDSKSNYGIVSDHPELVDINYTKSTTDGDWIHANSLDYNSSLDQIIIGSRNLNEFWIIDHSTTTEEASAHTGGNSDQGGDILYRWGNSQTYTGNMENDQKLYGQHDVHWINQELIDGGDIMIFNNGFQRPEGAYSSIDIITPSINNFTYNLDNNVFGPMSSTWSYQAENPTDFYSFFMSSAQRLPNGNLFICSSASGTFFEINARGETVWKYINPDSRLGILSQGDLPDENNSYDNIVFRATKYALDYEAFSDKDISGERTIENDPNGNDCSFITATANQRELKVNVYPQPAINTLSVIGLSGFDIINLQGANMISIEVGNRGAYDINVKEWPAGIYIITDHYSYRKKIVIQ